MEEDYFDELFAEAEVTETEPQVIEEKAALADPLERSQRARKIIQQEAFEGPDNSSDSETDEPDSVSDTSLPSQRPQNRPKLIPTGSQSDDKILEARRDFDEALARMKPSRRRKDGDSEEIVSCLNCSWFTLFVFCCRGWMIRLFNLLTKCWLQLKRTMKL